tara:strand:- start:12 stop:545 length:534 start_codon:yes stop_codon:yes gene_type:complete
MKKIIAFGASSSKQSINKKLASYAASQINGCESIILNLEDFEMPIYSIDKEEEKGIPKQAYEFKDFIKNSDGVIISFAEHNGSYTAAFKNIYDWISRIEKVVWDHKPLLLLSTSPGERAAKSVLEIAKARFSGESLSEIPVFSLPSFNQNFDENKGIIDRELNAEFKKSLHMFEEQL